MTMLERKAEELREKAEKLDNLNYVVESFVQEMRYNAMDGTDDLDEDGRRIYIAPDEDDYRYPRYLAYKEVLELIEKTYCK